MLLVLCMRVVLPYDICQPTLAYMCRQTPEIHLGLAHEMCNRTLYGKEEP